MVYSKLNLKKETTNPKEMKIKDKLVLQGMTQAAADEIEYNTMGAFQKKLIFNFHLVRVYRFFL